MQTFGTHYTILHYSTVHYTTLYYTTLHCTALDNNTLHCTAPHVKPKQTLTLSPLMQQQKLAHDHSLDVDVAAIQDMLEPRGGVLSDSKLLLVGFLVSALS